MLLVTHQPPLRPVLAALFLLSFLVASRGLGLGLGALINSIARGL